MREEDRIRSLRLKREVMQKELEQADRMHEIRRTNLIDSINSIDRQIDRARAPGDLKSTAREVWDANIV